MSGKEIPGVTMKDKQKALEFLEEHKDEIDLSKINMRSFGSAIKLIKKAQSSGKDYKPLIAPVFGLESWKESK